MALTPALPAPLPKWAKVLLKGITFVTAGLEAYFDHVTTASSLDTVQWRYMTVKFTRATPAGTVEDHAQFGINIANLTGGDIDSSWTTTDYTQCETAVTEWLSAIKPKISSTHTATEIRWYVKQFNPSAPWGTDLRTLTEGQKKLLRRFALSGPPQRITPIGFPGTGTDTVAPYQNAISITWRTPVPAHWGRIYVPGLEGSSLVGGFGRINSGTQTLFSNMSAELVDDLWTNQFQIVVPSTQTNSVLQPSLLTTSAVVVDDIPDVIRRRRAKQAASRLIGVPTP
jgi:hypothetical protein